MEGLRNKERKDEGLKWKEVSGVVGSAEDKNGYDREKRRRRKREKKKKEKRKLSENK